VQYPGPAPRESAPVGAGFPEGKAFDILGVTIGMPGSDAMSVLKSNPTQANKPRLISLIGPDLIMWASPQETGNKTSSDNLHFGWTASTTRQEVVSILRFVSYPAAAPANLRTTLAELKEKYGVPTWIDTSDESATLYYSIANGEILKATGDAVPCFSSFRLMITPATDASATAYPAAMSSAAGRNRFEPTPCQAILYIKVTFAKDHNSGAILNDLISQMDMRLLDMKRLRNIPE
jgi:hypothetical protein